MLQRTYPRSKDLEEYNRDNMADVNNILDDFQDDLREAESELDSVQVFHAGAKVALVLYLLLMVAFIAATILAMLGREMRVLTKGLQWIGMPLFIFLTVTNLTWIVLLPVLGGMNSDFCLPRGEGSSPNDLAFEVLQREGFGQGNSRYDAAEYFIRYQCQGGKSPYAPLNDYLEELVSQQISGHLRLRLRTPCSLIVFLASSGRPPTNFVTVNWFCAGQ